MITYRKADGSGRQSLIHGEALVRLKELAEELAEEYGWFESDAVTFVLTGRTPSYGIAIRLFEGSRQRVAIAIDPMVPRSEVARIYEELRRELKVSGARKVDTKTAALAVFLASRRHLSWTSIREAWNDACTSQGLAWHYDRNREFARDGGRAWLRVVGTNFQKGATSSGRDDQ